MHDIVMFLSLNQGNLLFRNTQINSDSWPTDRKEKTKSCPGSRCDKCDSVVDGEVDS